MTSNAQHRILKTMNIFAIETSCDETAAAVVCQTDDGMLHVRSSIVASQIALHAQYGGVVPNLAAREHESAIMSVMDTALEDAHLSPDAVDLVAVTHAPGLIPALIVGVSAAKAFAWVHRRPLMGVHHLAGHIYAARLDGNAPFTFPVMTLIVSGGHTQLVLMRAEHDYTIIGQTVDDAAGEAFDKVARMLGLPYPGGPAISAAAERHTEDNLFSLPRPMLHSGDNNFSFSGLKTAVLYRLNEWRERHGITPDTPLPDTVVTAMSAEFQNAVTDVLVKKTLRAAQQHNARTVILAGGVSANSQLRTALRAACTEANIECRIPPHKFCVDNAAMIAAAAATRYTLLSDMERQHLQTTIHTLDATATCPLSSSAAFGIKMPYCSTT